MFNNSINPPREWTGTHLQPATYWTDGSVLAGSDFWHTRGAYAYMDHNGFTKAGPVTHISLSSFITELWALMAAFSDAPGPCLIVTDCQNLCNQVTFLLKHNRIPRWWIHQSWWKWLKALLDTRKQLCAHPLQVQWSPADLADNLQDEQITDVFAHSHETTRTNIINNKVVDQLSRSMLQHCSTAFNMSEFESDQLQIHAYHV